MLKPNGKIAFSYNETKAPWPVSNRDVIVKMITSKTMKKIEYNYITVEIPEHMPVKKKIIRMTSLSGAWILIRKGNETHAKYQAKSDPAGSIPSWLANKTGIDQLFKFLNFCMD